MLRKPMQVAANTRPSAIVNASLEKAKTRMKEIITNGKNIEIGKPVARGVYGRDIAEVKVDGRDPGDILRAEGLAKCHKGSWCN